MSQPESRNGLKWDGTVTLGTILAAGAIAVTVIGTGNMALGRMDSIQAKMNEQASDFKELRTDVNAIKLQLAGQDGMRSKLDDHESRIRRLEGRG